MEEAPDQSDYSAGEWQSTRIQRRPVQAEVCDEELKHELYAGLGLVSVWLEDPAVKSSARVISQRLVLWSSVRFDTWMLSH